MLMFRCQPVAADQNSDNNYNEESDSNSNESELILKRTSLTEWCAKTITDKNYNHNEKIYDDNDRFGDTRGLYICALPFPILETQ